MINERIAKLKNELINALDESLNVNDPLEKLNAAMELIERAISGLNELIEIEDFENEADEIDFFKNVKPQLLALKIEEIMNYNIEINRPIGAVEAEVKYYKREIETLQGLFRMNGFHYQYYKNGVNSLDHLFFLREAGPLQIPSPDISIGESQYSTPMTYLFAKFIAYENLQNQLREKIFKLNNPGCSKFRAPENSPENLKWTGDLVNLVELIYGLWLTGQFNNGNASLGQIVRWMETNLEIKIGVIQRKFAEIESRKRTSHTKFIDQMKDGLLRKIEGARS